MQEVTSSVFAVSRVANCSLIVFLSDVLIRITNSSKHKRLQKPKRKLTHAQKQNKTAQCMTAAPSLRGIELTLLTKIQTDSPTVHLCVRGLAVLPSSSSPRR